MVSMNEEDRDALQFLWVCDVREETPEVTLYRFT